MIPDPPKYSAIEIERRWWVDVSAITGLEALPYREIHDLYVGGTRLRLRKITDPTGAITYKFGKKYGKRTATSEPVANLYLGEAEYRTLSGLPGVIVVKRRYPVDGGALDVYLQPAGVAVFEMEFDDEASAERFEPPPFATREITGDPESSGAGLAGMKFR